MGIIEKDIQEWTKKLVNYRANANHQFSMALAVFENCKDDFDRYGVTSIIQKNRISINYKSTIWDITVDAVGQISINTENISHDRMIAKVREVVSDIALKIAEDIVMEQQD